MNTSKKTNWLGVAGGLLFAGLNLLVGIGCLVSTNPWAAVFGFFAVCGMAGGLLIALCAYDTNSPGGTRAPF